VIFRIIAWLLLVAIVVLSFVPASNRPMTGAPSNMEHLAIYVATGFAFAVGYADRLVYAASGLVLFSGMIEMMQALAPSRHARLTDFLIDAGAAVLGMAPFVAARRWVRSVWAS
jgi:VanZ family protein